MTSIDFTVVGGSGKFDMEGVGSVINTPESLSFNVTAKDGDGDTTSGVIPISIDGGTTLQGTASNDVLVGGSNDETLIGGAGNDTLTGNGGADTFVFDGHSQAANGIDTITDFLTTNDEIVVDVASLNLPISSPNAIDPSNFHTGAAGNTATWSGGTGTGNEFVFDTTTNPADHALWYSADGTGNDKIELAHISTGVVQASDIHIA